MLPAKMCLCLRLWDRNTGSLPHKCWVWLVRQQASSWLGILRLGEQGGGRGQVVGGVEDGHHRRGGLVRASNGQFGLFRLFLDMFCP